MADQHLSGPLSEHDRRFLSFALDLAFDKMVSDEGFTEDDSEALKRLRLLAGEPAHEEADPAKPTEEQLVRDHVLSLHLIGEQLSTVEGYLWERLSRIKETKVSHGKGGTGIAGELVRAAQILLDLADAAQEELDTGDYWKPYSKETAWKDGLVNGFSGAAADLAGAINPAAVRALAAWLRTEAATWAGDEAHYQCSEQSCTLEAALDFARRVNAVTGETR